MRSLMPTLSRLQRQVRYLAGYIDLTPPGPSRRAADFGRARQPILLLHGFLATRRAVEVLERRLQRDGFTVFSFNFGTIPQMVRHGVDDIADMVRAKIERLYERHPGMGPLTIVGHSQGGLIAAWYVKKLGGWRRVRALVTLGTPHHGTPKALFALPLAPLAPAIWQMTPNSSFIERLNRAAWPAGLRLTSIWSRQDGLAPYPSARVEVDGNPNLRNIEVVTQGHRDFLFRRRIYDVLLRDLREAAEQAPSHPPQLHLLAGGQGEGGGALQAG